MTENHFRNPETWDAIVKIIARLDIKGISSDEMDSSSTLGSQRVVDTWNLPG